MEADLASQTSAIYSQSAMASKSTFLICSIFGGSLRIRAAIYTQTHTDDMFVKNDSLDTHRYMQVIVQEAVNPFSHFIVLYFILMHDNVRLQSRSQAHLTSLV